MNPNPNGLQTTGILIKKSDNQTLSFPFPIGLVTFMFIDNFNNGDIKGKNLRFYTPGLTMQLPLDYKKHWF